MSSARKLGLATGMDNFLAIKHVFETKQLKRSVFGDRLVRLSGHTHMLETGTIGSKKKRPVGAIHHPGRWGLGVAHPRIGVGPAQRVLLCFNFYSICFLFLFLHFLKFQF
jgi:hypothetical protein